MTNNSTKEEFVEKIQNELDAIENIRKQKINSYKSRRNIGLPIIFLIVLIAFYYFHDFDGYHWQREEILGYFVGFSIVIFILYGWVRFPHITYATEYKRLVLTKIAKCLGNFSYELGIINMDVLKRSHIIPNHTEVNHEDYFIGEYKGSKIEFAEITLQSPGKYKRMKTVFRGIAVLVHFQHEFQSQTVVTNNKKGLDKWIAEHLSKLKHANMVDPKFEKQFDVYTNDQTEVRFIINPLVIEALKSLNDGKVNFSVFENKMLILISHDFNMFEPNADLYMTAFNKDNLLKLKNELEQVLKILNSLHKIVSKSQKALD